jgi:hypothetical protein
MTARTGIFDPLKIARVVALLESKLNGIGLSAEISHDFKELSVLRAALRDNHPVCPLFDPAVTTLSPERAFWLALRDAQSNIVGLQAFRLDRADPNLADWALGWILGIYLKRSELILPEELLPCTTSVTQRISGWTAYQGEVWLHESMRGRGLLEEFSRFGVILAHLKWQPEAIWALTSEEMAKRGAALRMGYPHSERGFLKWRFLPEGADATEWISIAERGAVNRLVDELETTLSQCPPVRPSTRQLPPSLHPQTV